MAVVIGDQIQDEVCSETQESTQIKITIDPDIKNLFTPLSDEERSRLENSIKEEGCRDPLVVWENGQDYILVDGHNRYEICQRHNIELRC